MVDGTKKVVETKDVTFFEEYTHQKQTQKLNYIEFELDDVETVLNDLQQENVDTAEVKDTPESEVNW